MSNVPSEPGLYWAKYAADDAWTIVEVLQVKGGLYLWWLGCDAEQAIKCSDGIFGPRIPEPVDAAREAKE